MKIAILGGTGPEGAGLGLRWAKAGHEVIIGSRVRENALVKAGELNQSLDAPRVSGGVNIEAARAGEIVVLTVPYAGLAALLPEISSACRSKVVVSTVVPLSFGRGRLFTPPDAGSAAEEAQRLLGPEVRVVAGFHHIAALDLLSGASSIQCDLLLVGDDKEAKNIVAPLGRAIGLRVLDAGPLWNAGPLEGITALLVSLNRTYKTKHSGITITGLPP
jgi:NADPH-dependent F420 reductase